MHFACKVWNGSSLSRNGETDDLPDSLSEAYLVGKLSCMFYKTLIQSGIINKKSDGYFKIK
jgi:hypothetical protein